MLLQYFIHDSQRPCACPCLNTNKQDTFDYITTGKASQKHRDTVVEDAQNVASEFATFTFVSPKFLLHRGGAEKRRNTNA